MAIPFICSPLIPQFWHRLIKHNSLSLQSSRRDCADLHKHTILALYFYIFNWSTSNHGNVFTELGTSWCLVNHNLLSHCNSECSGFRPGIMCTLKLRRKMQLCILPPKFCFPAISRWDFDCGVCNHELALHLPSGLQLSYHTVAPVICPLHLHAVLPLPHNLVESGCEAHTRTHSWSAL